MKEKLIALLSSKFAGARKDGLSQLAAALSLQATTEEEATAIVEKLTADNVSEFIRDWRSAVDKEVTDGAKTYELNLKKKYNFVEKKEPQPGGGTDGDGGGQPSDIAAIVAQAVKAAVEPLQQKLQAFEGQQVVKTRIQLLEQKLTGVPDTFKAQKLKDFSRMRFDSDEEFTQYLAEAEADIAAFNQELATKGLLGQPKPLFNASNKTDEEAFIESMKAINAEPSEQ